MAAKDKVGAVMVVGGGIAGKQSALDLGDSGFKVYLVESKPTIGGSMAQLDKTFPTNDCSMCIMAPKLVAVGGHENIDIITKAEVSSVDGKAGNFDVTLTRNPRYVDDEKCTGCGICSQTCPVEAIDMYNEGLMARAAIYLDYPQAVPLIYAIDKDRCIGCGICEGECPAEAIVYEDESEEMKVKVGSVILSPGFDEFDPDHLKEYGYGRFPNVLSSIEFERMLSSTGPHRGLVLRPSDGKIPQKVAFIQCVGSRHNKIDAGYCSSVCCMYSLKEAIIAKEHASDMSAKIFFMDIRAFGKEFDEYVTRAEEEYNIDLIRSARIPDVQEIPDGHNLLVRYEDGDELKEEEFNMVVLAVGLHPPASAENLSKVFGVDLNSYKFASTSTFAPLETSRKGVFVSGAFTGPKDIPATVAEASGAAGKAQELISPARGTLVSEKEFPPERDVSEEEPRIGVFVCHCGINIGGVVDVPSVAEYARTLPGVAYAEDNLYTCSQDTQERIKEQIDTYNLNRVIVASCTPRTHEPLFQNTIREGGLNPYLFEMANIRDQCSWTHMHMPAEATIKARDLVRMAVAKARHLEPLKTSEIPVTKAATVIGGGITGMTAARSLADQGYKCYLIEKEKKLGGNLRNIHHLLTGEDPQAKLQELVDAVNKHSLIEVITGAEIELIDGYVGNFQTQLKGRKEPIEHGVVILATGGTELKPEGEYLYGEDKRVFTQLEFEKKLADSKRLPKSVVMIQCVGSRNDERPYCSRVCCSDAVKNAIKIKQMSPGTQVTILYRDLRTYGFKEDYFRSAREHGVHFVRYDTDLPPTLTLEGDVLVLEYVDLIARKRIRRSVGAAVLSAATLPSEGAEELAKLLKVPLNKHGFFLEAHMKLRPVDFATDGVFLAGMCHSPKFIDESIGQANGAVARAVTILSKDTLESEGAISEVDEDACTGCGTCIALCPYAAIERTEDDKAKVTEVLCKGCGICAASCPERAIDIRGFTTEQMLAQMSSAMNGGM
jgi:heterodisulfide reductase subunit A